MHRDILTSRMSEMAIFNDLFTKVSASATERLTVVTFHKNFANRLPTKLQQNNGLTISIHAHILTSSSRQCLHAHNHFQLFSKDCILSQTVSTLHK